MGYLTCKNMNSTKKTLMALIFATTAILAYGSFVPLQVSYAIGQEGGQEAPQTQDQDVAQGQGPGNPFTMDRGDWQMKAERVRRRRKLEYPITIQQSNTCPGCCMQNSTKSRFFLLGHKSQLTNTFFLCYP